MGKISSLVYGCGRYLVILGHWFVMLESFQQQSFVEHHKTTKCGGKNVDSESDRLGCESQSHH